jgi:hypothetical protein
MSDLTTADDRLIMKMSDEIRLLRGVVKNMLGAFDNPIARRRDNSQFANEARLSAHNALDRTKHREI